MPWVATKCTSCGGQLEVNTEKEYTVCPYCNMAFVNEKAINNYNFTIQADVANVIGISDDGKALLTRIDQLMESKKHDEADSLLKQYLTSHPTDGEAFAKKAINDLIGLRSLSDLNESIRLAFHYLTAERKRLFFDKIVKLKEWDNFINNKRFTLDFFTQEQQQIIRGSADEYDPTSDFVLRNYVESNSAFGHVKFCQFIKENLLYSKAKQAISGVDFTFNMWMDAIQFGTGVAGSLWFHPVIEEQVNHTSPQLANISQEKRTIIISLCNQLKQLSSEARTQQHKIMGRHLGRLYSKRWEQWDPIFEKYNQRFGNIVESLLALR